MKKMLSALIFITALNLYSAVPTAEGLFRNGNNGDVEGNLTLLTFIIKEDTNRKLLDSTKISGMGEKVETLLTRENVPPRHFKVILGTEDKDRIEAILVEYSSGQMTASTVVDVKYFSNILEKITNDDYVERSLFYSLLNVLTLNDSRAISSILAKYNQGFLRNDQLLNEKKLKMLKNYKNYLQSIKDDESLRDQVENPLKPEDSEKLKEVKESLDQPMYNVDKNVTLARENTNFYWLMDLENTKAKFHAGNWRLAELLHKNGTSSIKFNLGEYILFDGVHELPKYIFVKDLMERVFKVQITSYKSFLNNGENFVKRYQKYIEILTKNNSSRGTMVEEKENMAKLFVY